MALSNNVNDRITQLLLIITLTLSSYVTFANTQLDNSVDEISNKLEKRLNNNPEQIIDSMDDINSRLEYNTAVLKGIENRLDVVASDMKDLSKDLEALRERVVRLEVKGNS